MSQKMVSDEGINAAAITTRTTERQTLPAGYPYNSTGKRAPNRLHLEKQGCSKNIAGRGSTAMPLSLNNVPTQQSLPVKAILIINDRGIGTTDMRFCVVWAVSNHAQKKLSHGRKKKYP